MLSNMEQNFNDFCRQVTGSTKGKEFKIRNSLTTKRILAMLRKDGWANIGRPLTGHEFHSIIRSINQLLADELKEGRTVKFPFYMGQLELRKIERGVKMVDGNLKVTYPVNWHGTLKLWYEDEEARKNKILLRHEVPYKFYICHNRSKARFVNKIFYAFKINWFIRRALKDNIKKGKVDTLW